MDSELLTFTQSRRLAGPGRIQASASMTSRPAGLQAVPQATIAEEILQVLRGTAKLSRIVNKMMVKSGELLRIGATRSLA